MNTSVFSDKQTLCALEDLDRVTLSNASGLTIDLYPNGAVCAIRCCGILVNQAIGVPPEGAPFGLWLRDGDEGVAMLGRRVISRFGKSGECGAAWHGAWNDWSWTVRVELDEKRTGWSWIVDVTNGAAGVRDCDVVIAQDIGLGVPGAVRSNECYASHYIDHRIVEHGEWGPVVLSRQNLSQDGRHPWLASACTSGAAACATDGLDVFGLCQRTEGEPGILGGGSLPSRVRQGESACAALQSAPRRVDAGGTSRMVFSFAFEADHPEVSSEDDLAHLEFSLSDERETADAGDPPVPSIWDDPVMANGAGLDAEAWDRLYPVRHHEELEDGTMWSFFTDDGCHVVSAEKEAAVERSHGHVLCGATRFLPEDYAIGSTVYAPGVFGAQIFCGNPNMARLLSVVRDPLQRTRGAGQRVWVYLDSHWALLGHPSAFEIGLNHATWHYLIEDRHLELTSRVHPESCSVSLQCRVREGKPIRWMVTHQLALGANELEAHGTMEISGDRDEMVFAFDSESEVARRTPDVGFVLTCYPCHEIFRLGGDDMIWRDRARRGAPYAVVESSDSADFTVHIAATGVPADEAGDGDAQLPVSSWRIASAGGDADELDRILPWFRHDAWIHLNAPHGLEQYGGAAWGVRDVCQGPVEWLLTEQRYGEIRDIVIAVFAQQYEQSGLWPQWFMLGRYADIQQKHCHGDIMFWPLKALCDYAAAADDPAILDVEVPFTDDDTFAKTERAAPLSRHVEKVIAKYAELCIPGTALVAYGDGDWDDTLQPARPEMREGMVSTWTVELAFQVFSQLAELYQRAGRDADADRMVDLTGRIRADFFKHLMPDGVVAGFSTFRGETAEAMLHPRDTASGIHYRLLPMIRGVISGLFDPAQAESHRGIIRDHLRFPDGVHLMDRPVTYTGGISRRFQRAETAAYFGREVALQYVHAHIRYIEAAARMGDADEAWWGLQVINPLGLRRRLPIAAPRQANVYFSSSDADFRDRYEAHEQYAAIRDGKHRVKSGWRLYSSGPGLYLHKVRSCLFGIREHYDRVIFDPVLPAEIMPCELVMQHEGKNVTVTFSAGDAPGIRVNGADVPEIGREENPYRTGGLVIDRDRYRALLDREENAVKVTVPVPS